MRTCLVSVVTFCVALSLIFVGEDSCAETSGSVHFYRNGQKIVLEPDSTGLTAFSTDKRTPMVPEFAGIVASARYQNQYLFEDVSPEQSLAIKSLGSWMTSYRRSGTNNPIYLTNRLYVKLSKNHQDSALPGWLERNEFVLEEKLRVAGWYYVSTASNPALRAGELVDSGQALAAEPSFWVSTELYGVIEPWKTNDPYWDGLWTLHNNGPSLTADGKGKIVGGDHAHVAQAWELIRQFTDTGAVESIGTSVRLAVIDDGFDIVHEDLADAFVAWKNFADEVEEGTLFSNGTHKNFHGTMVAGIAAARGNNGLGLSGTCPGCKLIGVRMAGDIMSTGMTPDKYFDEVFGYAMDENADIINCSWGPDRETAVGYFEELVEHITTTGRDGKGTVMVFASGNSGEDFSWNPLASHPRAIAVGGSDSSAKRHDFSNYGEALDLLAPTSGGEKTSGFIGNKYIDRIWTTDNFVEPDCLVPGKVPTSGCSDSSGWTPNHPMAGGDSWWGKYSYRFSHTSAAAPLVSGIVGVMLHANPDLTSEQVRKILIDTADRVSASDANYDAQGHSPKYGYGRVNALRAVAEALEIKGTTLPVDTWQDIEESSECLSGDCWEGSSDLDSGEYTDTGQDTGSDPDSPTDFDTGSDEGSDSGADSETDSVEDSNSDGSSGSDEDGGSVADKGADSDGDDQRDSFQRPETGCSFRSTASGKSRATPSLIGVLFRL